MTIEQRYQDTIDQLPPWQKIARGLAMFA